MPSILSTIKSWLGIRPTPPQRSIRRILKGRYDAAQTNADDRRHWSEADALSARAANSLAVRTKLRERARYESANNSYCRGIVLTLANDLVGTGPRLQVQTADRDADRAVEIAFGQWAQAVRLAEKLRTLAQSKVVDGEAFAVLTTNPELDSPVQLDLSPIECDRVTDDFGDVLPTKDTVDGITYDRYGNPATYRIRRSHPGDDFYTASDYDFDSDVLPARSVLHWFRCDRPGQCRGVPEITPALPLFAQLRRYTLAVIAAAETAADFAAVLQSDSTPNTDESIDAEEWDTLELQKRMMTVLPMGWKLGQLHTEQPPTTYDMFKREILSEISRCLNMPYVISSGDYAGANYASGRQAHQVYFKSVQVERFGANCHLARIFRAWLDEAVMVPGLLPRGLNLPRLSPAWYWDGWEHVDPTKEAQALSTLLGVHGITLAEWYAGRGLDWEEALRQRAKEIQTVTELGIPPALVEDPGQPWRDDPEGGGNEQAVEENRQPSGRNGQGRPPRQRSAR